MRLTLRTMLAYLDGCFDDDPAVSEELSKKIEEHEFASNLVHRIRNSMRRLRLGAPPLEGKGTGLDPNTVAEYLDNLLPQERIPDFERVCLESDVHLAEVASCHQVLSLVVREPVEIDPALRQRMYHLRESGRHARVEPTSGEAAKEAKQTESGEAKPATATSEGRVESAVSTPAPAASEPTEKPTSRREPAEVPDYLREANRPNLMPLAVTLILAFLLAAVALRAMGPFDREHPLLRMFAGNSDTTVASSETNDSDSHSSNLPSDSNDHATSTTATESPKKPAEIEQHETTRPAANSETNGSTVATESSPPNSENTKPVKPVAPTNVAEVESAKPPVPAVPPVIETLPDEGVPDLPPPTETTDTPPVSPPADSTAVNETKPEEAANVEAKPVEVGRFLSENQPLIRWDNVGHAWKRLMPRALLASGDRLIALPSFRPQILLSSAIQVELDGPSSVRLARPAVPDTPNLIIDDGRVWLLAVGKADTRIDLSFGDRSGTLQLRTADALMAIEVRNYLPPGSDPNTSTAIKVVQIFGVEGQAEWRESLPSGATHPDLLNPGDVLSMVGDGPAQVDVLSEQPTWMEAGGTTSIERLDELASPAIEQSLTSDRPVMLSLQEKTSDRRQEVRSLAARSLAYLDDFEPFFAFDDGVMRNDNQRSHWTAHFHALRDAVMRGPQTAAALRRVLEKFRPEKATELYRMLWGYSPEQLADGEAAKLVDYLNHDDLDFRVLAFENLYAITDRTQDYAAYKPAAQRKSQVRAWQDRLKEGLIVYKEPPSPLPQRGVKAPTSPPVAPPTPTANP